MCLQDLYAEIELQRQACERIIASKDKLIGEIKAELKKKDDEFVKTLKKQVGRALGWGAAVVTRTPQLGCVGCGLVWASHTWRALDVQERSAFSPRGSQADLTWLGAWQYTLPTSPPIMITPCRRRTSTRCCSI